jgi:hypothetical protein
MSLSVQQLGTLKRTDARTVWKNEAQHFTPCMKRLTTRSRRRALTWQRTRDTPAWCPCGSEE